MTGQACSYSFLGNLRQKDCLSPRFLGCSASCHSGDHTEFGINIVILIIGITSFPEEVSTGKMKHAKNKRIDVLRTLQTLLSRLEIIF